MNHESVGLEQVDAPPRHRRSLLARAVTVLAFAVLTVQLWRLQIVDNLVHRAAAEDNSLRPTTIQPLRGVIYDRNMTPLAVNAPTFVATITEADVPAARRSQIFKETADILGMTVGDIEQTLRSKSADSRSFTPIAIMENVPRETALQLEERSWALPGVNIQVATVRQYVDGPIFSHIVGYTALPAPDEYAKRYKPDGYQIDERVGATGVEQSYEADLHGHPGARLVEVDVSGRPIREVQEQAAEPGHRVILSIDADLQRAVYDVMKKKVGEDSSGVAIVMDPRNGEILAMVSIPGFDNNLFAMPNNDQEINHLLSDPRLPLFDRSIAGQYPPGSTFKLVTGIGALEEGVATRDTRIDCNGGLRIPNPYNPSASTYLPDWGVMGVLDFVQGLAQSCNVYFYTLGGGYGPIDGLKADRIARYARMLGYGERTGIDLSSEAAGRVPTPAWKQATIGEEWVPGDTYHMAIGQGDVLATPLQVANLTNAIATGGTFYRPHVVRSVADEDGQPVHDPTPQVLRQVTLKPETISAIRDGMAAVMDTSQAKPHNNIGVRVAGKTGTAEYAAPRGGSAIGPTHGWFTAYAPVENPRVSVTVFVEHGGGPSDALPPAMDILREYFERYP
ncbi:MAG TPA: penicillin-binding protein 2 [Chloroflexota bacterium]|nr:penicillin-binding protein 2 [Chloroflexota bacterium]